jgi:hypothetical protein
MGNVSASKNSEAVAVAGGGSGRYSLSIAISKFVLRGCFSWYGAPGAIPTRDLSLRRRALYATELREHKDG